MSKEQGNQAAFSIFVDPSDDVKYFLHPECVSEGKVWICQECLGPIKKGKLPKYSVANGWDFGDPSRIGHLQPLSFVEKHLIARSRLYSSIVKISPRGASRRTLKGHVITFLQDGPEAVSSLLSTLPSLGSISQIQVFLPLFLLFLLPSLLFNNQKKKKKTSKGCICRNQGRV